MCVSAAAKLLLKRIIKLVEHLDHVRLGRGDLVQLAFHMSRELQVQDLGELLDKQIRHRHTKVRRVESPFFLLDVAAILDRLDDWRICAGATDCLFFEGFDEGGLAVPRRGLREMLGRVELVKIENLPHGNRRQELVVLLAMLGPHSAVPVELLNLALCLENPFAGCDRHIGDHVDGGCHLTCEKPVVDELVETKLIVAQVLLDLLGCIADFGRTDCFVRFLGHLAGGIANRLGWQVAFAKLIFDSIAHCQHGFVRNPKAVSSHICDQTDRTGAIDVDPFVQLLGDPHRLLAWEAQPDRALLLQRTCFEWSLGLIKLLGLVDLRDLISRGLEGIANCMSVGLGLRLELGPVELSQGSFENVLGADQSLRAQARGDFPVFLGYKGADLAFPVGNQPDRDRLNSPGTQISAPTFFQSSGLS